MSCPRNCCCRIYCELDRHKVPSLLTCTTKCRLDQYFKAPTTTIEQKNRQQKSTFQSATIFFFFANKNKSLRSPITTTLLLRCGAPSSVPKEELTDVWISDFSVSIIHNNTYICNGCSHSLLTKFST